MKPETRRALEYRLAEDRDLAISLAELALAVEAMSFALSDHLNRQPVPTA
jgi:hypothetical protein